MSLADDLKALTPVGFEDLSQERREELIAYNDEHVRQWRAVCQWCGEHLSGTRVQLREHMCRERQSGE